MYIETTVLSSTAIEMASSPLYLNIIWHQHQPSYLDPELDQLQGPWVRTHGTKDYYDMASLLSEYPDVHCTFNLTSSLMVQIEEYYVRRLKPFIDVQRTRIDTKKFLARWKGKTDPWIDLALKPTGEFDEQDKRLLLNNPWNALYISDVMLTRFPEYRTLKDKAGRREPLSENELRDIKFWFFLAYFDPDFLERPVRLVNGTKIDLTDLVYKHYDGTYRLKKIIVEEDCHRMIAETYKVMSAILPIHKKMMYIPGTRKGQIDVITTPFYHPILPLVYDSDLAKVCQPGSPMPVRFHFPQDADVQVGKAVDYFFQKFGRAPSGMWPAEGAVAQQVIQLFSTNGIEWIATDEQILARSTPAHLSKYYPYRVGEDLAIVFRDTVLSDKIGFTYQSWKGIDAADDFVQSVLQLPTSGDGRDRLLTVILDGENAWEWYRQDNDGKEFLHSLYLRLSELFASRQVVTVTMSEYIHGNPDRMIPPHPLSSMERIDALHPGSWINANYDTWIGNEEKNRAWEYLRIARDDLGGSGVSRPESKVNTPRINTRLWYAHRAWEEMYAAEGSDWFWWYGTTQRVHGGTTPFDLAFIGHLNNVYAFARLAGGSMPQRTFAPITSGDRSINEPDQGAMKQSKSISMAQAKSIL
jgi:alpha-amylase/alpha-mannosidase (GH57 family)